MYSHEYMFWNVSTCVGVEINHRYSASAIEKKHSGKFKVVIIPPLDSQMATVNNNFVFSGDKTWRLGGFGAFIPACSYFIIAE